MSKRVLLTGHGGFVGHHCLNYFIEKTDWELICIDSFRHKGTCRRIAEIKDSSRVKHYKHDLSVPIDRQLENLIFERQIDKSGKITEKPINYIVNLASDSAVERSTADPIYCIKNNVDLMLNMLEFSRKCNKLECFFHLSTDEVYGEVSPKNAHKEWSSINPSNPYSSSKAAQESFAIAYWRTYNLPIVIGNCMNIIGERQDPEKFLPKIIQKIVLGEEMPIYGDSLKTIGSRVYLHAMNLADAILFILKKKPASYSNFVAKGTTDTANLDRYNICGDQEVNNLEMAQLISKIVKKELKYKLIPSESARPGYDKRYMLDNTKLKNENWNPPLSFNESLERIVAYTINNPHWII